LLRGYYFDNAPELALYPLSVPSSDRLRIQGIPNEHWQGLRTVAGMIAVITAVLIGSTAGLVAIVASDHSPAATLSAGIVVAVTALVALTRYQHAAWKLGADTLLIADEVNSRSRAGSAGAERCLSQGGPPTQTACRATAAVGHTPHGGPASERSLQGSGATDSRDAFDAVSENSAGRGGGVASCWRRSPTRGQQMTGGSDWTASRWVLMTSAPSPMPRWR
jgi:hypothetical protein